LSNWDAHGLGDKRRLKRQETIGHEFQLHPTKYRTRARGFR